MLHTGYASCLGAAVVDSLSPASWTATAFSLLTRRDQAVGQAPMIVEACVSLGMGALVIARAI